MSKEYGTPEERAQYFAELKAEYEANNRYLIGTPVFSELREGNHFYIDKTKYVFDMAHSGARYVFLSRPRRFGKSLLVSTLQSYFEGRKELFKGLAIDGMETEWKKYPVIHLDLSTAKGYDRDGLVSELSLILSRYERKYGRNEVEKKPGQRLNGLIERAYAQSGEKVVVLIDEYDTPMLDVIHEEENLPAIRKVMQNFYSPLKACGPYLKFVFLTGITKFSQVSIFSTLNNITNISMLPEYAAVCGITEEELLAQMPGEVDKWASRQGMTRVEALREIKSMYDGYHFCWPSPDIYNPYSLMNALRWKSLDPYWFDTGTPTFLINVMNKFGVGAKDLGDIPPCRRAAFDAPTENMTGIIPLFYQSGYFTIKGYDPDAEAYVLDIPNREIRMGLYQSLLPNYIHEDFIKADVLIGRIGNMMRKDRLDEAMKSLQTFFGTIPYLSGTSTEAQFQRDLGVIFSACGLCPRLEERTAAGRVDLVYESRTKIYLIELKLDRSAEEALRQINERGYADLYALDGRPIVKVGVNFSSSERNITDWVSEEQSFYICGRETAVSETAVSQLNV